MKLALSDHSVNFLRLGRPAKRSNTEPVRRDCCVESETPAAVGMLVVSTPYWAKLGESAMAKGRVWRNDRFDILGGWDQTRGRTSKIVGARAGCLSIGWRSEGKAEKEKND